MMNMPLELINKIVMLSIPKYAYIPRAIGPQDPEDFRQDRRDEGLPVNRSVWTTCGHVVSVRNELALAVRFE